MEDNQMVYRFVSPLWAADGAGCRDSARVAGSRVTEHLPSGFIGFGPQSVTDGFPFTFQIPSCSHLLWPTPLKPFIFLNLLGMPHFTFFSSISSATSCTFPILSGLQPPTSFLGPAVCVAPCLLPLFWPQVSCPLSSPLVSTQIPKSLLKLPL